jgi:hypothetical protein
VGTRLIVGSRGEAPRGDYHESETAAFSREGRHGDWAAQLGILDTTQARSASPELAAIGRAPAWLNSPRLTPDALVGKVVLVQFCTYTCINWLRTLPYVRAWERKYRQQLVVIGVCTHPSSRSNRTSTTSVERSRR